MIEVRTLKNPINDIGLQAGQFVKTELGEGLIVGFSSVTDNPLIYIYNEDKIICFYKEDLLKESKTL